MYLRLMWDRPPDDTKDERLAIEIAFRNSPFPLIAPPEEHPRGGFHVHVDCTADDYDGISKLLQQHNLISVI
ncbi:MAG TPA: hypothetical protein PKA76_19450 [Pirellulaceae bacterium]|nr:hypothetical protein [Pirellulaceae bacterium]